jgi:hypothetical protein
MLDKLTLLRAAPHQRLAKIWRDDGSVIPAAKVKWFEGRELALRSIEDIRHILNAVEGMPRVALVKEKLAAGVNAGRLRRRCAAGVDERTGEAFPAGLVVVPRWWICFDVEKLARPATLAFDDGAALARYVRELLPEPFKRAACVWQLSGSSGHPSKQDEMRLHLFFMLDAEVLPQVWKPYFAGLKFVDPSAFDRGKLIFTAAPIIHNGVDPIACRHGLIEGDPRVTVPKPIIEQSARIASGADTPKRQEPAPAAAPMPEAAKAFVEIIAKSNILRSHHEAYRNDRARRLAFCAMLGTAFGITDEEALAEAFDYACVGDDDGNGEHDAEQALAWAASPSPSGRSFSPRKLLSDASVALHAAGDAEMATRAARLVTIFWQIERAA